MLAALLLSAAVMAEHPSVVVVVLDDVGTDMLGCYGDPRAACTPNIDLLAAGGLRFTRAYVNAVCSPSRAAMLTGQYGFRTGVGIACAPGDAERERCLEPSANTIPEALAGLYGTAAVGKWHLGDLGASDSDPNDQGFGVFRGSLLGFVMPTHLDWIRTVQGSSAMVYDDWSTTRHTIDLLQVAGGLEPPAFVWMAPNAPHFPYELPPSPTPGCLPLPPTSNFNRYRMMLADLDRHLGVAVTALLDAWPGTYVFLIGDNGTPGGFDSACPRGAKQEVYEGGILVPLIVFGPGIEPGVTDELVSGVDLMATLCELVGVSVPQEAQDSISFLPVLFGGESQRDAAYAEYFRPNGLPFAPTEHQRTMLDARWKLIRRSGDTGGLPETELFDLLSDPCEAVNLYDDDLSAEEQAAFDRLLDELDLLGMG